MNKAAWFFSIIFHPLLLLNYSIFLILYYHPYYNSRYYEAQLYTFVLYSLANTLIIPSLSILIFKRFKMVDNFQMSNHKQRTFPYLFIAILLCFTVYQLLQNDMRGLPIYFIIGCIVSLLVNLIINLKFGISSHAIASGGFIASIAYLVFISHISVFAYWLPISILIAGISGFSRLWLNAHTPKQIYLGCLLGFVVVFSTVFICTKFNILG